MSEGRKVLDKFFKDVDNLSLEDRKAIWWILTALRGPDYEDIARGGKWKADTTQHIRGLVCDSLTKVVGVFSSNPTRADILRMDELVEQEEHDHFRAHVWLALRGLRRFGYIEEEDPNVL
jgi:hypothetical protein